MNRNESSHKTGIRDLRNLTSSSSFFNCLSSPVETMSTTPQEKKATEANIKDHFLGDFSLEDAPSYDVLLSHNLLTREYRLGSIDELDLRSSNSTRWRNFFQGFGMTLIGLCSFFKGFEVPQGAIRPGYNGRGDFCFFGPGVHAIVDIGTANISLTTNKIDNGDLTIATVQQGFIGLCYDRGQPLLLPPGIHQWKSPTLKFEKFVDLNQPVIVLGPWTLLTIDQGYMAVTQDNGKQIILDGGNVYLLTHRNWKFEKFVSTKIQTDILSRSQASSADNVIIQVDATVLWRIADVETAVRMSAETMNTDGSNHSRDPIKKLRNDVLKQAEASLAYFIGTINFSDSMAAAAMNQRARDREINLPVAQAQAIPNIGSISGPTVDFNLYNNEKLDDAVTHANEITGSYGVEIISINIISAIPADSNLRESLAAGAVAAAEAQMMETTAQGKSRAIQIEAKAQAEQTMILAKANADADIVQAEGAKAAADMLASNPVSVELAKIERTGRALAGNGNSTCFFFGADPQAMHALLSNNDVVRVPASQGSTS